MCTASRFPKVGEHLNELNTKLQGRNKLVTQYYDHVCAFKMSLALWETQLAAGDAVHFASLKDLCTSRTAQQRVRDMKRYKDKIAALMQEFEQRFQIFGELEKEFKVFSSPFTAKASDLPSNIQLEIIELQCDLTLKSRFDEPKTGLDTFYKYLVPRFPNLTALAAKVLCMFGTTYLCEQIFSVMTVNKTKLRSRLTNENLNSILKLAVNQGGKPDIDALVKAKRCQVSGAK